MTQRKINRYFKPVLHKMSVFDDWNSVEFIGCWHPSTVISDEQVKFHARAYYYETFTQCLQLS